MIIIYNILTCCAVIIAYPAGLILALFGRTQLLERLRPPSAVQENGNPRVWIHAASVGEAGIAFSMAGEVKKTYPGAGVFISTITTTGLARIRTLQESSPDNIVDSVFLAPLDCILITGKFIERIKPTLFLLVETELWPALISSLQRKGIPISIINGKLGRRGFRRYMVIRFALRKILRGISLICVQSKSFSRRFRMLGVPPENIEVIGNIKFDSLPDSSDFDTITIRRDLGLPPSGHLFVAGSTRPGEEKALANAFIMILEKDPDAVMVIVPRHLKRLPEIARALHENSLDFVTRTSGNKLSDTSSKVLILDTMGELIPAYACADIAFVGGSLRNFGGHNPLEPAALGIPVLFGPYMEQTGSKELLSRGAAGLVQNEEELAGAILSLFTDAGERERMGRSGKEVVHHFRGTLARTLHCMESRGLI